MVTDTGGKQAAAEKRAIADVARFNFSLQHSWLHHIELTQSKRLFALETIRHSVSIFVLFSVNKAFVRVCVRESLDKNDTYTTG